MGKCYPSGYGAGGIKSRRELAVARIKLQQICVLALIRNYRRRLDHPHCDHSTGTGHKSLASFGNDHFRFLISNFSFLISPLLLLVQPARHAGVPGHLRARAKF